MIENFTSSIHIWPTISSKMVKGSLNLTFLIGSAETLRKQRSYALSIYSIISLNRKGDQGILMGIKRVTQMSSPRMMMMMTEEREDRKTSSTVFSEPS